VFTHHETTVDNKKCRFPGDPGTEPRTSKVVLQAQKMQTKIISSTQSNDQRTLERPAMHEDDIHESFFGPTIPRKQTAGNFLSRTARTAFIRTWTTFRVQSERDGTRRGNRSEECHSTASSFHEAEHINFPVTRTCKRGAMIGCIARDRSSLRPVAIIPRKLLLALRC
jgi:hypothetical protein